MKMLVNPSRSSGRSGGCLGMGSSSGSARSLSSGLNRYKRESRKVVARLRRIFKGPPRATEYTAPQSEKPYRHVPTHAGSDFLRTTTSPAMKRAEAAAQVQPSSTTYMKMKEE